MATETQPVAEARDRNVKDGRRWLALSVVLVGAFLVIVAASMVNLAIPSIRRTLHASFGEVEFVIAGYSIVYAVFLVTGGRLGDLYGRKRLFMLGLAVFTAAALLCGLAPNTPLLIALRMFQGLGAALMYPQMIAIIQAAFEGQERNFALGLFGAVIGVGFIAGQLLGGLVIDLDLRGLSWRPSFLVLVPIGVVAILGAAGFLPGTRPVTSGGLDFAGVGLLGLSLLLLMVPLLSGREAGWPAWLLALLLCSVPAFVLFLWFEARQVRLTRHALLDPALLRQRAVVIAIPIAVAFFAGVAGFTVYISLTLQVGFGFTALGAGLASVPTGIGFLLASLLSPRLVPSLGRHVMSLGFFIMVVGNLATLAIVHAAGQTLSSWEHGTRLFVIGTGQGLGMAPLIGTVVAAVRREDAGVAAGVLSTSLYIGQGVGIALLGLVFFLVLDTQPAGTTQMARYLSALQLTLPFLAALSAVCFLLVFLLPGPARARANALLERVPNRLAGLAYSFYFATGGHAADRLMADILQHTVERRTARIAEAPREAGEFLVHHYEHATEDATWYRYLVEEALALGSGPLPHEAERQPVIDQQVDEIRARQTEGRLAPEFDPAALRLMAFALSSYPRLLPQIVRMATGVDPESPEFHALWDRFLRQLGRHLESQ